MRIAAGASGIVVLLGSAVFTLGVALAAPVGMWIVGRIARRRQRPFSPWRSWVGAASASSVITVILAAVLLYASPHTLQQFRDAMHADSTASAARRPGWLARVLPQPTRPPGPVTTWLVHSRAFSDWILLVTGMYTLVFLGSVAGSAGWVGSMLVQYAVAPRSGRAAMHQRLGERSADADDRSPDRD